MTIKDLQDLLTTVSTLNTVLTTILVGTVVSVGSWFRKRIEAEIKARETSSSYGHRLDELERSVDAAIQPSIEQLEKRMDRLEIRVQSHIDDERERRVTAALGEITGTHRPIPYGKDP